MRFVIKAGEKKLCLQCKREFDGRGFLCSDCWEERKTRLR